MDKLIELQNMDLFGVAPSIRFRGQAKSYSFYGLIFTVMIWGFIIWAVVFTSQDLFKKTNPSLVATTLHGATARDNIILSHDTFQLGFGIYDNAIGNYFIDPTIYTVEANMGTYELQADGSAVLIMRSLDIRPCVPSDFDNHVDYYENMWCFSKQQTNFDQTLSVRTKSDSFINVLFKVCDDTIAGNNCATQTVRNAKLAGSYFMTTYKKTTVDSSDYSNPISGVYVDNWKGVLLEKSKEIQLSLDVVEFNSDNGWLFESKKKEKVLNINEINADVLEIQTTGSFITFLIVNSGNKIVYDRSYMKVPDVLAQVSGLASTVVIILGFLAYRYAELKMYEKTINDVYKVKFIKNKVDDGDKKSKHKTLKKNESTVTNLDPKPSTKDLIFRPSSNVRIVPLKREKRVELTDSALDQSCFDSPPVAPKNSLGLTMSESPEKTENPLQQNDSINESKIGLTNSQRKIEIFENSSDPVKNHDIISIETEKEDLVIENEPGEKESEFLNINISYFEWLVSPFRSQAKLKLLKKGQVEVENCLDLLTLVKKIKEIDKLKACLMTTEQQIIYENLKQPILSIDISKKPGQKKKFPQPVDIQDWSDFEKVRKKSLTLKEAYQSLKESKHQTQLCQKLLQLYESDQKSDT